MKKLKVKDSNFKNYCLFSVRFVVDTPSDIILQTARFFFFKNNLCINGVTRQKLESCRVNANFKSGSAIGQL